jgi:pyruvate dehydrogenase E2 component (dihydrolipoamide acetyltransferase)
MSTEVRLPEIADNVTTARVAVWLKKEGDRVSQGEPIVEVETDKTTVEVEAPADGVIQTILVPAGAEGVAINAVLAIIGDASEVGARVAEPTPARSEAAPVVTSRPRPVLAAAEAPASRPVDADVHTDDSTGETVQATPLARRMAAVAGVSLDRLAGGGPLAKVTKADVDRALGRNAPSPLQPPPARSSGIQASLSSGAAPRAGRFRDTPLSAMRRATAARLQQAKATIPHFYLQAQCEVHALVLLREQLNRSTAQNGTKITITDLLVLAISRALIKVPAANAAWMDDAIRSFDDVDIAVAVNTPTGLITPIIRETQLKNLAAISRELKELSGRARTGALRPDEYTGGTCTISNLGMFNVSSITPIINPPHACIVGVGAIETVPVARNDALAIGRVMNVTLAADHRVIDGADGAAFLGSVRQLLEDPMALALQL